MRSYWEEDLSILSAENVGLSVEAAGLGSRFAASLIDLSLQSLVAGLFGFLSAYSANYWTPLLSGLSQLPLKIVYAAIGLVTFFFFIGYYFFFEWLMDGQTPGKRWLGLRVMQTSGLPLTMWAALTRNVLRLVDFLPFLYGVGALVAITNPLSRRVGDWAAGTVVAREKRDAGRHAILNIDAAADAFLASLHAPPGSPILKTQRESMPSTEPNGNPVLDPFALALHRRLDEQDYELVRDFLKRRDKLPEPARGRLARSLATRIGMKLGLAETPQQFEPFLEDVVATLAPRGVSSR